MNIEQAYVAFQPVVITLETKEEVELFCEVFMNTSRNEIHYTMGENHESNITLLEVSNYIESVCIKLNDYL